MAQSSKAFTQALSERASTTPKLAALLSGQSDADKVFEALALVGSATAQQVAGRLADAGSPMPLHRITSRLHGLRRRGFVMCVAGRWEPGEGAASQAKNGVLPRQADHLGPPELRVLRKGRTLSLVIYRRDGVKLRPRPTAQRLDLDATCLPQLVTSLTAAMKSGGAE
jgi:hypothetical protein